MDRPRRTRFTLLAAAACGLSLVAGCQQDGGETMLSGIVDPFLPPTPGQAARDAFNVHDPDKRRASIALLSTAPFGGEAPYVRTYRLLVDDPDATVRAASIKALGMHGTVEDATLIVPRLKDSAAIVRWEAARALQRIHNPVAINPLIEAMRTDEDADVRMAAANALGQYAQGAVFDALVGQLTDPDYAVVQSAVDSLTTLTGHKGGPDPAEWVRWADANRANLFANQQRYTFQPYSDPPGFVDKMQFWRNHEPTPPQQPVGVSDERAANG